MPGPARVEFEGALSPVITRGNNRQVMFQGEDDYWKFLSLLQRATRRHPFSRYALVLMTNGDDQSGAVVGKADR